jgi:hypothetical protein
VAQIFGVTDQEGILTGRPEARAVLVQNANGIDTRDFERRKFHGLFSSAPLRTGPPILLPVMENVSQHFSVTRPPFASFRRSAAIKTARKSEKLFRRAACALSPNFRPRTHAID